MKEIQTYHFTKNRSGRYVNCNRPFASLIGAASKSDIIGLKDSDLPWQKQSSIFAEILDYVVAGNLWINKVQPLLYDNNHATILISLIPDLSNKNGVDAVNGYFTMFSDLDKSVIPLDDTGEINISPNCAEKLSKSEIRTLQHVVAGKSYSDISSILNRSKRTIESQMEAIRAKFMVDNKAELLVKLYRSGQAYRLLSE